MVRSAVVTTLAFLLAPPAPPAATMPAPRPPTTPLILARDASADAGEDETRALTEDDPWERGAPTRIAVRPTGFPVRACGFRYAVCVHGKTGSERAVLDTLHAA